MRFDWEEFKSSNSKIAVHCKTEEEAKDFLTLCNKNKVKYLNDDITTYFNIFKSETVYAIDWESSKRIAFTHSESWKRRGYSILEWSNYMNKEFTLDNIEVGMVTECRNGRKFLKINKVSFCNNDSFIRVSDYKNDMKHECNEYDIVKVYDCKNIDGDLPLIFYNANESNLVWERESDYTYTIKLSSKEKLTKEVLTNMLDSVRIESIEEE